MAKSIKYMGTADVATLEKGENFDGRLADGLPRTLVFDRDNKWTVDADDLSSEALELLAEAGFKDVTDLRRIPSNEHQKMFLGHKDSEPAPVDDENQNPSGASDTAVTTVGGSTEGDTGKAAARRRT